MTIIKKVLSLFVFFVVLFIFNYFITYEKKYIKEFVMEYKEESVERILHCKCEMKRDKKNGKNVCYDEDGNFFLEEHFLNDKRSGEHIVYYPSGNIKENRTYSKDSLDGKSIDYYPNGIRQFVRFYRNGEYVYEKEFDEAGELMVSGVKVNISKVKVGDFKINNEYGIKFQLDYSEYDTLFLLGLFDTNNDKIFDDTIFSKKDYLVYKIIPDKIGRFELNGLIIEVDGHKMIESGEGAFKYEYEVK